MNKNINFGYLGNTFQIQLINNILLDNEFANSIIDVIEQKYFDNQYFKLIIQMIKEYYYKYEHTPSYNTLEQIAKSEISSDIARKVVIDTLQNIKDTSNDGDSFVQEKALKFCKQQELKKVIKHKQS